MSKLYKNTTDLQELFLDEAKSALNAHSPVNDDQIKDIVTDYLD